MEKEKGIFAPLRSGVLRQIDKVAWADNPYTSLSFFARHGSFNFSRLPRELRELVIAMALDRRKEDAWNLWAVSRRMREMAVSAYRYILGRNGMCNKQASIITSADYVMSR